MPDIFRGEEKPYSDLTQGWIWLIGRRLYPKGVHFRVKGAVRGMGSVWAGSAGTVQTCTGVRPEHLTEPPRSPKCMNNMGLSQLMIVHVDPSSCNSDIALLEDVPESGSLERSSGMSSDKRPQYRRQAQMSSGHPSSGPSQSAKEEIQKSLDASLEISNTSPRPRKVTEYKSKSRLMGHPSMIQFQVARFQQIRGEQHIEGCCIYRISHAVDKVEVQDLGKIDHLSTRLAQFDSVWGRSSIEDSELKLSALDWVPCNGNHENTPMWDGWGNWFNVGSVTSSGLQLEVVTTRVCCGT
ncbi:hypothetical protein BKA82DRAFT_4016374 [Pisolithus tinctorius]|nr:hypothetical protein BKA82DRAFT_4016374 [Pisolithus tinctorius]